MNIFLLFNNHEEGYSQVEIEGEVFLIIRHFNVVLPYGYLSVVNNWCSAGIAQSV